MRMRFGRGISVAIALGLVVLGSTTSASGSTAAGSFKFKEGVAPPFAATRFDGATVGGDVYFLGFRAGDDSTDGSVWYYNIKKKKYVDTGTDMPNPVSNYAIAVLKDKTGTGLYIFGGRDANGGIVTDVQVYYPATNTAKEVKSDPWPGTTPSDCVSLPGTGVTTVGNTAYVLGGMSFSTSVPACTDDNSKQVWSFDPMGAAGKKWTAEPSMKASLGYIAAVTMGTTIYAIGGDSNAAGTLTAQPTVEAWKVGSKKWDDKDYADMPEACDETQAFGFSSGPLANTITVAGCGQWSSALPDVLQYDVTNDSWANVGSLKEARRNQAGASIGTAKAPQLLVVGGYASDGSTVLQTAEVGTPSSFIVHRGTTHAVVTGGHISLF